MSRFARARLVSFALLFGVTGLSFAVQSVRAGEPADVKADGDAAEDPVATLPEAARSILADFRKVAWKDRLKPARGATPPKDWDVGVRAEWIFGSLGKEHRPALEALLGDADPHVRMLAARSLGLQGDAAATPALAKALAKARDTILVCRLIEALARTGGEGALEAVEKLQKPGVHKDVQMHIGLARRQLKGGKWDVASMRAEHVEAARTNAIATAEKRKPAPELGLPSPDGPVNLSVLRDKIVVLVFLHGDRGTTDNKVVSRLALEKAYFERHDVEVVLVAPHGKERTEIWRQRTRQPYRVVSDPAGRGAAKYGIARQLVSGGEWLPCPAWFVIDRKGKLVWQRIGTKMGDHASLGQLLPIVKDVANGVVVD